VKGMCWDAYIVQVRSRPWDPMTRPCAAVAINVASGRSRQPSAWRSSCIPSQWPTAGLHVYSSNNHWEEDCCLQKPWRNPGVWSPPCLALQSNNEDKSSVSRGTLVGGSFQPKKLNIKSASSNRGALARRWRLKMHPVSESNMWSSWEKDPSQLRHK